MEYLDLDGVLRKYLILDLIFIRGHQKYDFLTKELEELSMQATVLNTEHVRVYGGPTCKVEILTGLIHRFGI